MEVSAEVHAPTDLLQGKEPPYSLGRWALRQSGRREVEKKFARAGNRTRPSSPLLYWLLNKHKSLKTNQKQSLPNERHGNCVKTIHFYLQSD
jgi:hypothetical protein